MVPFKGLQIISTVADEEQVATLLDESGDYYIMCNGCESTAFVVEAIIKARLNVSFGKPDKQIIVRERVAESSAIVLRIIRCATCNSSDFIKEKTEIKSYVPSAEEAGSG
jgi:DNA-directed RNA polymerase subunit RPC12/RpoP